MPEYRIGFSRKNHILAKLIRASTHSEASHCYIRRIDADSDMVLEAVGGHGVSLRPYSVFMSHGPPTVLAEYQIRGLPATLEAAWALAIAKVDSRYAWGQLVGDWLALQVEHVTGKRPKNPLASRAYVCSELALYYLRRAGCVGFARLDETTVSPEDLWPIVQDHVEQFVRVAP
jgi:hypothetical protein